ncbi:hypothetical protein L208DRAFT_28202 [Tricholoma matsutake]|nr:hypothetical protein L208DRAFT_28202 [Tricholoma matsutake 945]
MAMSPLPLKKKERKRKGNNRYMNNKTSAVKNSMCDIKNKIKDNSTWCPSQSSKHPIQICQLRVTVPIKFWGGLLKYRTWNGRFTWAQSKRMFASDDRTCSPHWSTSSSE